MPRLRRSQCTGPGYSRRRRGKRWCYFQADGTPVTDPDVIARIDALVLPPAWRDVWICPFANGHIQATGIDARGRTQYRYHDHWRVQKDREKFDHMILFARQLPTLRRRIEHHLADVSDGLSEDRVLATAARLLDLGFFRIGSDSYAEQNQTYGLATMLKRHVRIEGDALTFDFVAKAGKRRVQTIVDAAVLQVVSELKSRRGGGAELLAWRRSGPGRRSTWVDVDSDAINRWIRDQAEVSCSAKDFRTWNATVLAAVALAVSDAATSERARQRCVVRAMNETAYYLGNTPAVVRRSYVDPRVVDRYLSGETIAPALEQLGKDGVFGQPSTQGAIEAAVLDLVTAEGRALAA
jgi:DNA topoisomerase-1